MNQRTYYLETFGCQMNVLDSELVEGQLQARGLRRVGSYRQADVILFNTCSVRQHAEDKVLSRLGQLRGHKERHPEKVVGILGCMAEREREGLFVKAPHVDLLCGPGELNRLPALLEEVWERNERVAALAGSLSRRTEVLRRALESDSLEALDLSRAPGPEQNVLQSYIRVQRGCDKFCTYCVVPFTRGPERSRPPAHIVDEARMLAERGCREITLLGQTVNSYVHLEDGRPVRFARLLERVHEVPGIDRIRFVTSFPADWDETIFRVMRDCPRIMPYLHIPAQSGSDRVLRAMRRTYRVADYLRLMDTARRYLPHISLAGDIIVGFCGETEDDFRATVDLVRQVQYAALFVFKYSPRPGTAAERNLDDDVPAEVKARRNHELLAVQAEISRRHKEQFIGHSVEVLVEGFSKRARLHREGREGERARGHDRLPGQPSGQDRGAGAPAQMPERLQAPGVQRSEQDRGAEAWRASAADVQLYAGRPLPRGQLVGRTPGDLIVVFDGDPSQIGSIAQVRIERVTPYTMFGRLERVLSPPRTPPRAAEAPPASPAGRPLPVLTAR